MNWNQIISEIVAADSAGMNQVKAQQTKVNSENTALGSIGTDLTNLENSIYTLEDPTTFSAVTAGSTSATSSWIVNASNGTPIGNTTVAVSNLATASVLSGAQGISQGISPTDDVTGATLSNLGLATPVTAGTFTVNGQPVTITTSESLQDVFTAIAGATSGNVTGSYDSSTDKIKLTATTGTLNLGAVNDSSNFLQAMELNNNGGSTITSASALGELKPSVPLASAGFSTALTGPASGSFTVNGVSISFNTGTDSLSTLIQRINNSGAGVTASYDTTNNRMSLVNNQTGNTGIGVTDVTGNLAAALGLTTGAGAGISFGQNAVFSINGGPTQTSASNDLTSAQLGVSGLSVTINTADTQTIGVVANTTGMQTAIQGFITAFNQVQTDITTDTKISTSSSGSLTTSLLSATHEVGDWGSQLEMSAFSAGSGLSGSIKSLDALGIDFNGITGQLQISDSAKLSQALSSSTSDVASFFQTAKTGFGSIMNSTIADILGQDTAEQSSLQSQSTDLGNQITAMQTQLTAEQAQLVAEFTAMETMEAQYQSELSALNSIGGSSSGSSSSSGALSTTTPNVNVPGSTSSTGSTTSTTSTTGTTTG